MLRVIKSFVDHHKDTASYMRGEFDGPPIPPPTKEIVMGAVFKWKSYKLRPMGSDFRAVVYQNDRIGAQALVNGNWVDVEEWDDGWCDGSRVAHCRWRRMSETCMWKKRDIEIMREVVLGIEIPPKVI